MPVIMTQAEEVLVHLLKTNEAVLALVGFTDGFRIVPDQLPIDWKGKTSIVYAQQADKRGRLVSGAESGLYRVRFSIYCIDRNRGVSRQLSAAVRDAISLNAPETIAGVRVLQVFVVDGEQDESLPGTDGQDAPERYRTIDCVIHYRT